MKDNAIAVENLSKKYKLGQIGITTMRDELQRFDAKLRRKEDPTLKIGVKVDKANKSFMALDNISFTIKKGERIGVIGRNGAGKSTLLKLISRITAPTSGAIGINGRIASMLEVGTGFHPELTGRENIYMNGAILGMTKKEIDEKIEDIIEFSECAKFIDTPVKRYSSGMYVKLAFSVAAHLDAEIMIMDEVLAVGDMKFQQKCIEKMNEVSSAEGKTIIYVSHYMNTIRALCDRCIVLDGGKIIYDGPTEKAIEKYIGMIKVTPKHVPLQKTEKAKHALAEGFSFTGLELTDREKAQYKTGEKMPFFVEYNAERDIADIKFRCVVYCHDGTAVTAFTTKSGVSVKKGENKKISFCADISALVPGRYNIRIGAYTHKKYGKDIYYDIVPAGVINIEVNPAADFAEGRNWSRTKWGHVVGSPLEMKKEEE